MISADFAISRFRRDRTLAAAVKGLLIGGALGCLVLLPGIDRAFVVTVFLAAWLILSFQSTKGSKLLADSPTLISLGRFDEAEASLDQAMRSFSMFRTVKLLTLHHLAVLRHKQRQWGESAKLNRALLGQRLGGLTNLSKPSRIMLADALLQMGDLRGAYDAITQLYNHRLSLAEALQLMVLQMEYELRVGAPASALRAVRQKVDLCELLPANESAKAQATLALAAKQLGRTDWETYLRSRVELLVDVDEFLTRHPSLRPIFV